MLRTLTIRPLSEPNARTVGVRDELAAHDLTDNGGVDQLLLLSKEIEISSDNVSINNNTCRR